MRKQPFGIAVLMIALMASGPALAQKVYKWVDDDGVVHYETRPPKDRKSTAFEPKTGHSEPVNYKSARDEEDSEASQQKAEQERIALKDPERCQAAKRNLKALNNFGRVKVRNDDGSFHYLTEEEQQQKIQEAQKAMEESC